MIAGVVNARNEAVIRLAVNGPTGQTREMDAVIDTGYSEFLTLPPAIVAELSLPFAGLMRASLADGSDVPFNLYAVTVQWDGTPIDVNAYESNSIPLVGMALLRGHNLYIDVESGGRVVIEAIQ